VGDTDWLEAGYKGFKRVQLTSCSSSMASAMSGGASLLKESSGEQAQRWDGEGSRLLAWEDGVGDMRASRKLRMADVRLEMASCRRASVVRILHTSSL
jgi:hypothetical protein